MGRTELIVNAERDLAEAQRRFEAAEVEFVDARAHREGMRARLGSLQAGAELTDDLAGLSRTDAIEAVLRETAEPLRIGGIQDALQAAGRAPDEPRMISATLAHLLKSGRVTRVARGEYTAV